MANRFFGSIPDPDPAESRPPTVGNFAEREAAKRERQLAEGAKTGNPARPIKHYIYELDYFDN